MIDDIRQHLAERGLCFIDGAPPTTEDGVLLLYTGGCNAVAGFWDQRRKSWRSWGDDKTIAIKDIAYWMRMPHPSIWPTVETPATMIPERELYEAKGDIFATTSP